MGSPPDAEGEWTLAFGTPSLVTRIDDSCDYSWHDLGLSIHFANFGGQDPCGPEGRVGTIDLLGSAAEQAGWRTGEGARVGTTQDELRELYPEAEVKRGELVLVETPTPYGTGGLSPVLSAIPIDGEARAFRIWVGAAGE